MSGTATAKRGERTHDWGAVMDRWHAGRTGWQISAELGIPESSVGRIVCVSRKRGDERATMRKRPAGSPGTRGFLHYRDDPAQLALPIEAAPEGGR